MGTACCVADRKMPKGENGNEEDDIPTSPNEMPGNLFNDEDDPDNITDIRIVDKSSLQRDMKEVIQTALIKARKNTSDKAVPYLISSVDLTSPRVAILFKNYGTVKEIFDYRSIDKETITKDWVMKTFKPPNIEQAQFLDSLKALIAYSNLNKTREMKDMAIVGCVNEANDYNLYFCPVLL